MYRSDDSAQLNSCQFFFLSEIYLDSICENLNFNELKLSGDTCSSKLELNLTVFVLIKLANLLSS